MNQATKDNAKANATDSTIKMETAYEAVQPSFLARNKKKIIIGSSIIAVSVGGYFGWKYLNTKSVVETV